MNPNYGQWGDWELDPLPKHVTPVNADIILPVRASPVSHNVRPRGIWNPERQQSEAGFRGFKTDAVTTMLANAFARNSIVECIDYAADSQHG